MAPLGYVLKRRISLVDDIISNDWTGTKLEGDVIFT